MAKLTFFVISIFFVQSIHDNPWRVWLAEESRLAYMEKVKSNPPRVSVQENNVSCWNSYSSCKDPCWTTLQVCLPEEFNRNFVKMMTGPNKLVSVLLRDGEIEYVKANQIFKYYGLDLDDDGDIDLKDYTIWMNEQ